MSSKQIQTHHMDREEIRILDTYKPAPLQESDSDVDDVYRISYKVALESPENLRLFRLEHPHLNLQEVEQLEAVLYQEKRDIETLQGMARREQHQSVITGFFRPHSGIS